MRMIYVQVHNQEPAEAAGQPPASTARLRHALAASRIPASPAAAPAPRPRQPSGNSSSPPSAIPSPPPLQSSAAAPPSSADQARQSGPTAGTHVPTRRGARRGPADATAVAAVSTAKRPPATHPSKAGGPTAASSHMIGKGGADGRKAQGSGGDQALLKEGPGRSRQSPRTQRGTRQTRLTLQVTKDLGPASVHAPKAVKTPNGTADAAKRSPLAPIQGSVAASSHTDQHSSLVLNQARSAAARPGRSTKQLGTKPAAAAVAASKPARSSQRGKKAFTEGATAVDAPHSASASKPASSTVRLKAKGRPAQPVLRKLQPVEPSQTSHESLINDTLQSVHEPAPAAVLRQSARTRRVDVSQLQ